MPFCKIEIKMYINVMILILKNKENEKGEREMLVDNLLKDWIGYD